MKGNKEHFMATNNKSCENAIRKIPFRFDHHARLSSNSSLQQMHALSKGRIY